MALLFFNGFNKIFESWTEYSDYQEKVRVNPFVTLSSNVLNCSYIVSTPPPIPTHTQLEAGTLDVYSGDWWWVGVTTLGGFVIGLIRLYPHFPETFSLFREVRDLHVDPAHAPLVFIVSMLSLGIGAR